MLKGSYDAILKIIILCSDVTFDTEASKLVLKNETSHIEALYRSLILFAKSTWWRPKLNSPENHVTASVSASNEANLSAISFTL